MNTYLGWIHADPEKPDKIRCCEIYNEGQPCISDPPSFYEDPGMRPSEADFR
jgi:hypothetical protein